MPTKTQREREAEQRKQKLDRIKEQVEDGSLVIRRMTDEERKRYDKQRKAKSTADAQKPARRRRGPQPRS